jgi:hypothetical protein
MRSIRIQLAAKLGVPMPTIKLYFDGSKVDDLDSASSLELENDFQLEYVLASLD